MCPWASGLTGLSEPILALSLARGGGVGEGVQGGLSDLRHTISIITLCGSSALGMLTG